MHGHMNVRLFIYFHLLPRLGKKWVSYISILPRTFKLHTKNFSCKLKLPENF